MLKSATAGSNTRARTWLVSFAMAAVAALVAGGCADLEDPYLPTPVEDAPPPKWLDIPIADQSDICNGFDDNNDGRVDEGCMCDAHSWQPCYPGDPRTVDTGLCLRGVQQCVGFSEDMPYGVWGECEDAQLPIAEICGNGIDEDCTGEDLQCGVPGVGADCAPGSYQSCYSGEPGTAGQGLCRRGTRYCSSQGKWGGCSDEVVPGEEICNDGKDNDCNNKIDDCEIPTCVPGAVEVCYTGPSDTLDVGNCRAGEQTCGDHGEWGPCWTEVLPKDEICGNDYDENCDGELESCG